MQFSQPDTIIPDPSNPQALNRYSYALNNPIRYNDPTGHKPCSDEFSCAGKRSKPSETVTPESLLKKYNVTIDEKFTEKEMWAIASAVAQVGRRFAQVRNKNESGAGAFREVYKHGVNFTSGGEGATGMCASVTSGGCTSGANGNQINFWSMSNDMTKNVVHELGHAFYKAAGNPQFLDTSFSRNALIRNKSYGGGEALVWEQHPISMNKDGKDIPHELFADTFIAWTYDVWNPDNPKAAGRARNEMNRILGLIP